MNNTIWFSEDDVVLKITNSKVRLTGIDYIKDFEIKGDTLHFKHDFSHVLEQTIDGKKVKRKDFELPDSYFKLVQVNSDSIFFIALNPTAIHLVNELTHNFSYHLSEKEAIRWEKTMKRPADLSKHIDTVLLFSNIRTLFKDRSINKVTLSTASYNWTSIHYMDIIINNLEYVCRTINQKYDDKTKCEYFYYSGIIDRETFTEIEKLYCQSNIADTGTITYNSIYTSHDANFTLEVEHNHGKIIINGNRTSLPDLMMDFFDSIYREFPLEEDNVKTLNREFLLSKFNIN